MKKIFGVLVVSIFLIAACGGDGTETPAAFEDVEASPCVDVPVTVYSIGVLGQRVPKVSDLRVCADVRVGAGIVPEIQQFDDCGSPCYAVVINDFDIAADAKVTISYKTDGQPVTTEFNPEPVNHEVGNGRLCVVSVGGDDDTPDPCAERLTTPKTLTASASRKQILLSWRASDDTGNHNLLGYEIWRAQDDCATFGLLATNAETTFIDTSVVKGTTYCYYVVAFDEEGNRSQASNTAQATAK